MERKIRKNGFHGCFITFYRDRNKSSSYHFKLYPIIEANGDEHDLQRGNEIFLDEVYTFVHNVQTRCQNRCYFYLSMNEISDSRPTRAIILTRRVRNISSVVIYKQYFTPRNISCVVIYKQYAEYFVALFGGISHPWRYQQCRESRNISFGGAIRGIFRPS